MTQDRCAVVARASEHPAIGTIVTGCSWEFVPMALPWPSEIELTTADARMQAIVAASGAIQLDNGAMRFELDPSTAQFRQVGAPNDTPIVSHWFVCTHGSRDQCCGTDGMRLVAGLSGAVPEHVEVWRTSHLGGHRFAATAIEMPSGASWAWLTPTIALQIMARSVEPASVIRHFRGCAGAPNDAAQLVEREGLLRFGWDWLEFRREYAVKGLDPDVCEIRVRIEPGTATERVGNATVRRVEPIPIPNCGVLSLGTKQQECWELESWSLS